MGHETKHQLKCTKIRKAMNFVWNETNVSFSKICVLYNDVRLFYCQYNTFEISFYIYQYWSLVWHGLKCWLDALFASKIPKRNNQSLITLRENHIGELPIYLLLLGRIHSIEMLNFTIIVNFSCWNFFTANDRLEKISQLFWILLLPEASDENLSRFYEILRKGCFSKIRLFWVFF